MSTDLILTKLNVIFVGLNMSGKGKYKYQTTTAIPAFHIQIPKEHYTHEDTALNQGPIKFPRCQSTSRSQIT